MYLPNTIYHVYNHTNNRELLFRDDKDFDRFKLKIKQHLLPVSDIFCYCLMPTHFHFLLMPNQDGLAFIPNQRQQQKIHAAFRILLSSYSRYYNTKYDKRGSLIRAKTKYKPGYSDFIPKNEDLTEDTPFTRFVPYLKVCFRYIHQNPVSAGYALTPKAWRFGSAPDYASIRDEQICNYALSEKLLGIKRL